VTTSPEVTVIAAPSQPPQLEIRRDGTEPLLWEDTAAELVTEGPTAALAAIRSSVAFLLLPANYDRARSWKAWATSELIEAMLTMSEAVPSLDEAPGDLTDFVVELMVVLSSLDQRWTNRTVYGREYEDQTTSTVFFPLLENNITAYRPTITRLNECARRLRGPWLVFADQDQLRIIAEENPGAFLGEMQAIKDRFGKVVFESRLNETQAQMLQAFFRN
jgi:hypothetical protein